MADKVIGVIGGSGLYNMDALEDVKTEKVSTPFGEPSDEYITGSLGGVKMVFLPRHGKEHRLLPSEINYRANIYGIKKLGVTAIISVSAVGSMKEEIHPGDMVIVDQFFDRTKARESTFLGDGVAGHVEFAKPVCADLSRVLYDAAKAAGATVHMGGTYVCIEGPQFSTRAESLIYRSWGVDVIGMTNIPEAKLAREAGICYATIALSTDYDCWHEEEESVTVEMILQTIKNNVATARDIISQAAPSAGNECACGCKDAMRYAVLTQRDAIPAETKEALSIILGKYL